MYQWRVTTVAVVIASDISVHLITADCVTAAKRLAGAGWLADEGASESAPFLQVCLLEQ